MTLVEFMDGNRVASGCCGKILYPPPDARIWYAGAVFNRWLFRVRHRGVLREDVGQFDLPEETTFLTGCSIFVRTRVWEEVGPFDERFFAYSEDFDWCLRAREKGFRLYYVPEAVLYHKVSGSFSKKPDHVRGFTSPRMIELTHRNRLYLLRKHVRSRGHLLLLCILFLAKAVTYLTALALMGRFSKSQAVWRGLRAGMATD